MVAKVLSSAVQLQFFFLFFFGFFFVFLFFHIFFDSFWALHYILYIKSDEIGAHAKSCNS